MIKGLKIVEKNILPLLVGGAVLVFSSGCGIIEKTFSMEEEALSSEADKIIYELPLDLDVNEQDKDILNSYDVSEIKDNYKETTCELIEEFVLEDGNKEYEKLVRDNSNSVSKIYDLFMMAKDSNSEYDINSLMESIREFIEGPEKDDLTLAIPIIMASEDLARNYDCSLTDEEINKIDNYLGDYVSDIIDSKSIMNVWGEFVANQLGKKTIQYTEMVSSNKDLNELYNQLERVVENNNDEEVQKMIELERDFVDTCTDEELLLACPIIFTSANLTRNSDYRLSNDELDEVREIITPKEKTKVK